MDFSDKKKRDDIVHFIVEIFKETNKKIIIPYFKNLKKTEIFNKADINDFVSIADKKAEENISENLIKKFPKIKIIGEENSFINKNNLSTLKDKYYWTIDPIDGTKNYIKGNENFCSMISFVKDKKAIAAFIFNPLYKTLVYSFYKKGCYELCLEKKITKKNNIKINDINLIGSGSTKGFDEKLRNKVINNLNTKTKRVFIGSAGIETIKFINDKLNFILHGRVTPWDHSPIDLIIRESGGFSFMLKNQTNFEIDSKGAFLATNSLKLWSEIKEIILS